MYNQKIIKKIKRCAKEGSYDELLNYIKQAKCERTVQTDDCKSR